MEKIINVNAAEMIQMLESGRHGVKIAYIIRQTEVRMNKTNRDTKERNPFTAGITKVAGLSFAFGSSYKNKMNRVLEAAGEAPDFNPGPLWPKKMPDGTFKGQGEHVGPYTCRHIGTGDMYFFGLPAQDADSVRVAFSYMVDNATGRKVEKDEILPYIAAEKDRPFFYHIYKVDSVYEIHYTNRDKSDPAYDPNDRTIYRRQDLQRFTLPEAARFGCTLGGT